MKQIRITLLDDEIARLLNILRLEGKELTAYAIAKESGCSYNTAKKYIQGGK